MLLRQQAVPAAQPAEVEQLRIEEFVRVKLVIGQIKVAERVPKSKKLIRMEVDLGEPTLRQIVGGIGASTSPSSSSGGASSSSPTSSPQC